MRFSNSAILRFCNPAILLAALSPQLDARPAFAQVATAAVYNPDQTVQYDYKVPSVVAEHGVALLALGEANIGDRVSIISPKGRFAPLANSGTGTVGLGVGAKTGSLVSKGAVFLAQGAHVYGDVTTGMAFTQQSSSKSVDGQVLQQQSVPTTRIVRTAGFKYATGNRNVSLEPKEIRPTPLLPASYDTLLLKQGAQITLIAGDYYFRSVQIEPGATLIIDNALGTSRIYAGDVFEFKGKMASSTGADPKLIVTYLGGGQVFISGPFRGTIVAPNGLLNLERPLGDHHEGSFVAKNLRVAPDTVIVHRPLSWMIRNVSFNPPSACPGESVTISVTAGDPEIPTNTPTVMINGTEGTSLTEQFFGAPGKRKIAVSARSSGGQLESQLVDYEVKDCGDAATPPWIAAEPDLFQQNSVNFVIANNKQYMDGTAQFVWDFGDGTTATTSAAAVSHDFTPVLSNATEKKPFNVRVTVQRGGLPDASATRTFTVWSNYALSKSRGALEPYTESLDDVLQFNGTGAKANMRFKNIEPTALTYSQRRVDIVSCDTNAAPVIGSLEPAAITVPSNGQADEVISFTSSRLGANDCGAIIHFWGQTADGQKAQASVTIERPARTEYSVSVSDFRNTFLNYLVDKGLVSNPRLITEEEIARLYREQRTAYDAALGTFYQSAPPASGAECEPDNPGSPPSGGSYSCQPTGKWAMASPGWSPTARIANALKGDTIMVRSCSGYVRYIVGGLVPKQLYTHVGLMTQNYTEIRHSTGESDYLQNNSNGFADGLPSDGFEEQALRFLWPGTVTETVEEAFDNGRELMGADGRPYKHVKGFDSGEVKCPNDTDIVSPRVVKPAPQHENFARPILNQAADASRAINGHYRFSQYSNAIDTPTNDPNGPSAMPDSEKGDSLYGPMPTVCSSFIRFALRAANADVDKDKALPQPGDVTNGPPEGIYYYDANERLAAGNALYSAIYNRVQREIARQTEALSDKYHWWGDAALTTVGAIAGGPVGAGVGLLGSEAFFSGLATWVTWATDAPDDVANQVANCFMSDYCSEAAKDSDEWRNAHAGFAVSPDDIWKFYDAPSSTSPRGVYGYSESAKYRGKRYSQIYRWLPAAGTTTIAGIITKEAGPAANAQVEVMGLAGTSKAADEVGAYSYNAIPLGAVAIHAWKTYPAGASEELWENTACFVPHPTASTAWQAVDCDGLAPISGAPVTSLDVSLNPPLSEYRKAIITGTVDLRDCDCDSGDETAAIPYQLVCTVGPHDEERTDTFHLGRENLCADEIGLDLSGSCEWMTGERIKVTIRGSLYEGDEDTCGTNLKSTKQTEVIVKPDGVETTNMHVANSGACYVPWPIDCPDRADLFFIDVHNVVAD